MAGRFYIESLGCARNRVDSQTMIDRLTTPGRGWTQADLPESADLLVVNTCAFIEDAADESIDSILALARVKAAAPGRRLVVVGCLPERYREAIGEALPEVDAFLGTGAFHRILEVADSTPDPACILPDPDSLPAPDLAESAVEGPTAYLKIADGCDRHCTYCIIPRLRGRQRSHPAGAIIRRAGQLAAAGVRELVLVAQESTAYGRDFPSGAPDLADLLSALNDRVPETWIRVLYGHPESLTDRVIETIAARPGLCGYYDLPIQHAGDAVLQRMGRQYTADDLIRRFDRIRAIDPEARLRTTVMVGFPGETEADFEALLDLVETVRFHHLGAFIYSDGEDLPAHRLPDPVPAEVARDRLDRLMTRQQAISGEHNSALVGSVVDVLVESAPEPGRFEGRTAFQAPEVDGITDLEATGLHIGTVVRSKITGATEYDLTGVVLD